MRTIIGVWRDKTDRMKNQYTAVVKQDQDWWIGWIEEAPGVNCQEATREALMESLRITLNEALDLGILNHKNIGLIRSTTPSSR